MNTTRSLIVLAGLAGACPAADEKAAAKFEWTEANVGAAFDGLWQAMDRHYSYFFIKPDFDWAKLRDEYRPKAAATKSADELAQVLVEMLGKLKDTHVWIEKPGGKIVGTHQSTFNYNGNGPIVVGQLTGRTDCGRFATVAKTKDDGFGYFLLARQTLATPELVAKACEAIEGLADCPGFVVDLRAADGGNELLAMEIASRFCEKPTVYAKSKYRNGPAHDAFGPVNPRTLPAAKSGKPYLKPVVCVLGPGCISSGEGFAKMMAALSHVTTVGLPTRGASGNPKPVEVGATGLKVFFSRWVDMMPDGTATEGKGVVPTVRVEAPADAYRASDPTLEKALAVLRERVKAAMAPKE